MCNLIIHYCLGSSRPWDTYLHQNLYESIQVLVIKHEYYIKYRIQCTTFHMKVLSVDDDTGTNWSLQMWSIKISICSCICHIWKLGIFMYSNTYTLAYYMKCSVGNWSTAVFPVAHHILEYIVCISTYNVYVYITFM